MPQGGNFGGNSLPTTPIGGELLFNGRLTTYSNWVCSKIVATAATANFTYEGTVYPVNTSAAGNSSIDMLITPSKLSAVPTGVWFVCNECDCDDPMTGTTAFYDSGYGYITTGSTSEINDVPYRAPSAFAPTIIGGSGLNN